MKIVKRLAFFSALAILLWIAHHTAVYIHEWTHGFLAWIFGYKETPFAIHYGTDWLTLLDIDEAVPYSRILENHQPGIMAAIAIVPLFVQTVLFLVALRLIRKVQNRYFYAFFYWFTLLEICEIYSYIPIRTFSRHGDIYHFVFSTGISPWLVAIPGTLFVFWGIWKMLFAETPYAISRLKIRTNAGRWAFLATNIILFFGYYGGVGFLSSYSSERTLSTVSWILIIPIFLYFLWNNKKVI